MKIVIKIIKRILLIVAIALICCVLLAYVLLWIPPVQQGLKDIVLAELTKKTRNEISIGRLEFRPFRSLLLKDVTVLDLKEDTLLSANVISAEFDLLELFNDKLLITSVEMNGFTVCVKKDSINAPFNFQFFIDAFASSDTLPKKKEKSSLVVEIDDISLKNGRLSYDILSEKPLDRGFDSNHIHISDFSTHVQLKSIDIQKLDASIKTFTLKEQSGLNITALSGAVTSEGNKIALNSLLLRLPHSELIVDKAQIDYTGMEINRITQGATYSLSLKIPSLQAQDLSPFYLPFKQMKDTLTLEGNVEGKFPEINVNQLKLNYGPHIGIDIQAKITDYIQWATSPFDLIINSISIDKEGVKVVSVLADKDSLITPDFRLDAIKLNGRISGSLPDINLNLVAKSSAGNLSLEGKGGYVYKSGASDFDLNLVVNDFNVQPFMKESGTFGLIDLQLKAKGEVNSAGKINLQAQTGINRIDYNGYSYRNIQALAESINDSVSIHLVSNDVNLPLEITGFYNMKKKIPEARIQAKINSVKLNETHLFTAYDSASVSGALTADFKGFDPEKMEAWVQIDSLIFQTAKGTLRQPSILLNYGALANREKEIRLQSELLKGELKGAFSFDRLTTSINNTLSEYLPNIFQQKMEKHNEQDHFNILLKTGNMEQLTQTLNLPFTLLQPGIIQAGYQQVADQMDATVNMPLVQYNEMLIHDLNLTFDTDSLAHKIGMEVSGRKALHDADTLMVSFAVETKGDGLDFNLKLLSDTSHLQLDGEIAGNVKTTTVKGSQIPEFLINIHPSEMNVNKQKLQLEPAQVKIQKDLYTIENFKLAFSKDEFMALDGFVSGNRQDTLSATLSKVNIGKIMNIVASDIKAEGEITGTITASQLLSSPRIFTRDLAVSNIAVNDTLIGSLYVSSEWNDQRQGIFFQGDLSQTNNHNSTVNGYVLPGKDSLLVSVDLQAISLGWLSPFTNDYLFGLNGELGVKVKAEGKLSRPDLSGYIYPRNARLGVKMTNVMYTLSDSIIISPKDINFKDFQIKDENNRSATVNGSVNHKGFTSFIPQLEMKLEDFMVLNNSNHTDSLFYGNLKLNGSVHLTGSEAGMSAKMILRNSGRSQVFFKIPEENTSQSSYSNLTFINRNDTASSPVETKKTTVAISGIPVQLDVTLSLGPDLTLGTIINPQNKDEAFVNGAGTIDFSYNMDNGKMSLLGDYTAEGGQCQISLKSITRKVFKIQSGSKVFFKGDPMATAFDVTAIYPLRADLASLDQSFSANFYLPSTKVPVNCLIGVSGDLDKMNIKYDIKLPESNEEIQRQMDGLLYSDDMKMKQMAYLLAVGSFTPIMPSDQAKGSTGNIWTSLASSSLTSQLNNLLSGVLKDNWTVGTEFRTTDNSSSNVEMDVNISTHLFNNRLTVSSNIGYRNTSTTTTNFTGDFDVQYKLTESGNVILKMYNITNDNFYDQTQAPITQGVGVVYTKDAKTFKGLFKKVKKWFK